MRGSSLSYCVLSVVVLWLGRCGGLARKDCLLPQTKGWTSATAAPDTFADFLGACAERVPDCSSYLFRIPWSASAGAVNPRTRCSASLNASAANESILSGDLEAASLNASGRVDPQR